jgi:hypothetical protein
VRKELGAVNEGWNFLVISTDWSNWRTMLNGVFTWFNFASAEGTRNFIQLGSNAPVNFKELFWFNMTCNEYQTKGAYYEYEAWLREDEKKPTYADLNAMGIQDPWAYMPLNLEWEYQNVLQTNVITKSSDTGIRFTNNGLKT